jgi:hypothetical protein
VSRVKILFYFLARESQKVLTSPGVTKTTLKGGKEEEKGKSEGGEERTNGERS